MVVVVVVVGEVVGRAVPGRKRVGDGAGAGGMGVWVEGGTRRGGVSWCVCGWERGRGRR